MATLRHPRWQPVLRVCAILSLLAWMSGTAYCSLESLLDRIAVAHNGAEFGRSHLDDSAPEPANDSDHRHDSDENPAGHDSCCKSLTTVAQLPGSAHLARPQPVHAFVPGFLVQARALIGVLPVQVALFRHARTREWAFTPEVYLGPALRSNAPPLAS